MVFTMTRDQILERAAAARSPRGAAQVVLASVVETHARPTDVSLEEVKCLLVDAVRAWRDRNARQHTVHATSGQCTASVML
jgi:hypothetical protein